MRQITFVFQSIFWAAQSYEKEEGRISVKKNPRARHTWSNQSRPVFKAIQFQFPVSPRKKTFFFLWVDNLWRHPRFPGSSAVISSTKNSSCFRFPGGRKINISNSKIHIFFTPARFPGKEKVIFGEKKKKKRRTAAGRTKGEGEIWGNYTSDEGKKEEAICNCSRRRFFFFFFFVRESDVVDIRPSLLPKIGNDDGEGKGTERRKIWGEALKSLLPPPPYLRKIVFHYSPPLFFRSFPFPTYKKTRDELRAS